MPMYEYVCQECGEQVERLQKMSDEPLVDCPECGKPGLKRKISAAAFRLAGDGWYETDFKTKDKRNLADDDKKSSGDSSASSKAGKSKPAADKASV